MNSFHGNSLFLAVAADVDDFLFFLFYERSPCRKVFET